MKKKESYIIAYLIWFDDYTYKFRMSEYEVIKFPQGKQYIKRKEDAAKMVRELNKELLRIFKGNIKRK